MTSLFFVMCCLVSFPLVFAFFCATCKLACCASPDPAPGCLVGSGLRTDEAAVSGATPSPKLKPPKPGRCSCWLSCASADAGTDIPASIPIPLTSRVNSVALASLIQPLLRAGIPIPITLPKYPSHPFPLPIPLPTPPCSIRGVSCAATTPKPPAKVSRLSSVNLTFVCCC